MRGHTAIIKMRLAGVRPEVVYLDDFQSENAKDWHNPGARYGEVWEPDYATVQIDPKDRITSLDLRFLNGIRVLASGSTEERAKAIFEACKRVGVSMVIASYSFAVTPHRFETGWMELWNKEIK